MVQQKRKTDFNGSLFLERAFASISEHGWVSFSPQKIEIEEGTYCPHFLESKDDFLDFFEDSISKALYLTSIDIVDEEEAPKERLFDIMMERFDLLTPYKDGLKRIIYALPKDPKTLLKTVPSFRNLMIDLLNYARIPYSGLSGEIKLLGMSYIYLKTCRIWLEDDTTDSSKTMAELDKNLTFADQVATSLFKR